MTKRGSKKGGKKGTGFVYQQRVGGNYYFQYTENGKRRTVSLKTQNLREAEKKAKELRADVAELKTKEAYLTKIAMNRKLMKVSAVKLKNGWKHYLEIPHDDKPNSSAGTLENYQRNYKEFLIWMGKHYPSIIYISDTINIDIAKEYWQHLKNKGLSPSTLNYKRGSLLLMFRVLQSKTGITSNVWGEVPRAKATKRGANGLDGTRAKRLAIHFYKCMELLNIFNDPEFKLMNKEQMQTLFTIGIFTGLRLIDAVNLKWENIKTITNGKLIECYPQKTLQFGKKVFIPIVPQLQTELDRAKVDNESDFIIPSVVERYNKNRSGVNKDSLKIFRQAGYTITVDKGDKQRVNNIASVGFHSLRSSFFSYLAGSGITVDKLAEMSGDSVATLSKYYLKSERAELAKNIRGVMEGDKRLASAFDEVISIEASICNTEPEREQLKALVDTADIEKVRKALQIMITADDKPTKAVQK